MVKNQCKANTKTGGRCKNRTGPKNQFCVMHSRENQERAVHYSVFGGLIGHLVGASIGGGVLGALVGALASSKEAPVWRKKRVFVSYDFDADQRIKHAVVAQSQHPKARFEVVDGSLKEAAPDDEWVKRAERKIKNADLVLVLLGRHTYRATGVLTEIQIAKKLNVPIVQLIGYSDSSCRVIKGAGRVYEWNWKNLEKIFATTVHKV
ncbi:MAG TPA: hypothetical protein DHV59_12750 [Oxalobacteraceae bacterium]|nr:hypothetical protein [Oxalobacteraceae bacterium]